MTDKQELLRPVRTRRDKVLKFDGTDEYGVPITWYVAYHGKSGWSACRENGEWMDEPSDEDVSAAIEKYDTAKVVDKSEAPDEVDL